MSEEKDFMRLTLDNIGSWGQEIVFLNTWGQEIVLLLNVEFVKKNS